MWGGIPPIYNIHSAHINTPPFLSSHSHSHSRSPFPPIPHFNSTRGPGGPGTSETVRDLRDAQECVKIYRCPYSPSQKKTQKV